MQFTPDLRNTLVAILTEQRGRLVAFKNGPAKFVFVEYDAQRRAKRGGELIPRHPLGGQWIADLILFSFGNPSFRGKEAAMIAGEK